MFFIVCVQGLHDFVYEFYKHCTPDLCEKEMDSIVPFGDYWTACRLYIEAGNSTPFIMSPFGFMAGWFAFKPMNGEPPPAWRIIYWILGFVPLVIVFIDRSDVLSAIMKAMLCMGLVAHFAWDVVYRGAR